MDELLAGIYEALIPKHKVHWKSRYNRTHRLIGGCLIIKIQYTDVLIYINNAVATIVQEIPADRNFSKLELYRIEVDLADPKSIDRIQQIVDECYKQTGSIRDIMQASMPPS